MLPSPEGTMASNRLPAVTRMRIFGACGQRLGSCTYQLSPFAALAVHVCFTLGKDQNPAGQNKALLGSSVKRHAKKTGVWGGWPQLRQLVANIRNMAP